MSLIETISLQRIEDDCTLIVAENVKNIPFEIKRVYSIFDVESDLPRGFHAHHKTNQALFCLRGAARIVFDDGRRSREEIQLTRPDIGVLIPQRVWHEMHDLSPDTLLLVLADKKYNPRDYVRDYDRFKQLANGRWKNWWTKWF